jgi:predicted acylesterase/phospholipase RssA
MTQDNAIIMADRFLAGADVDPDDLKAAIQALKASFKFGLARKVLAKEIGGSMQEDPSQLWYQQQLALCTYRDEELPPARRFADALRILENIGLRNPQTNDAETLSLGGAVYKRMWESNGQLEHLYEALSFYRAAYKRNPEQDRGYGGINAAYVLQILSARARAAARRSGTTAVEAEQLEREADELRRNIADQLTALIERGGSLNQENWLIVTLAETLFGLKRYKEAGKWLAESKKLDVSEWERQTTFRQLVSIARLHGIELPREGAEQESWHDAWQALTNLLGEGTEAAISCYRGKVGLALSGGGFRASLYHLGVLARLAEMDVLRSVETLSTVSGGSIVGAHYYLEVKHLLETKADQDITREDYMDIVRRVQQDFLAGVQRNIRSLALADWRKNLEMIFSKKYTRSHRLGELYEEELFAKVGDHHPKDQPRTMRELLIKPKDEEKDFHPKFSNWRRRAKVPALLLNATSLNTGHNWHFTARSMGEPPGLLGSEVDKNSRYRRLWYEQAPTDELRNYRLGYAVAASACVPGLFEPLTLHDLYPDKVVRLVDGGVHDNQGVEGLLDEGCSFILCSDASGQMQDKSKPSDGLSAVLLRSNSVLMARVRESEYQDLRSRLDSRAVQGLFFVHLKKDLHVCPQDWVGCQDPTPESEKTEKTPEYGVAPELQRLLAGIRTDLDSFSDVEACALMCSGYLMTEQQFKALQEQHERSGEAGRWGDFQVDAKRERWSFLDLEPFLKMSEHFNAARNDLHRQLRAGGSIAFKIWKLDPRLKAISWAAAVATVVLLAVLVRVGWSAELFSLSISVGGLVVALGLIVLTIIFPMFKWLFPAKAARGIAQKLFLALFGFLAARIHLWKFDKMFLERGSLSRLLSMKGK